MKMQNQKTKFVELVNYLRIFRRSLIYQTKEFFENSTLHGVKYIAAENRPSSEKLVFAFIIFTQNLNKQKKNVFKDLHGFV